jgi:hypothetical protein
MRSFCVGERIIDPGQLQTMLSNFEELPTIPDILFHILKILDDPDSGASDLAEVVRLDVPLTARILRLANSPYYSTRGDMGDIHRCIAHRDGSGDSYKGLPIRLRESSNLFIGSDVDSASN